MGPHHVGLRGEIFGYSLSYTLYLPVGDHICYGTSSCQPGTGRPNLFEVVHCLHGRLIAAGFSRGSRPAPALEKDRVLLMTTVPKLLSIAMAGAIGALAALPPKIEAVAAEQLLAVRGLNRLRFLGGMDAR